MPGNWLQHGREWLARLTGRTGAPTPEPSPPRVADAGVTVGTAVTTVPVAPVIQPTGPVALTPGATVSTRNPQLVVAALPAGVYTFQLVVEDNLGAKSKPATVQIQVVNLM